MSGYTKLFNSILASTIWMEDDTTRIVWIAMLAMVNRDGVVEASMPGLASIARVSQDACQSAIDKLESPDKHSRSHEHAGRRIKPVDGGWLILNHAKYRERMNADERREYNRIKQQESRQRKSLTVNDDPETSALSAHTDSDTDSDTEKNLNPLPPLENQTPSAEDQNQIIEMDIYSAAKGLGELIGLSSGGRGLHKLVGAIQQCERRWPGKNRLDVVNDIVALWKEYVAQGHHATTALHNWIETVGSYIDSDHWRKKAKAVFVPEVDWQGGYIGEDGVYVTKTGKRLPGFRCPAKPREAGD
jgi:hypothetical protein